MIKILLCSVFFICFSKISKANPNVTLYNTQAIEAFNVGNYQQAGKLWNTIIQMGFDNGEIRYNLGNVYYRQALWPQAIHSYKKAKIFLPRNNDIDNNLDLARKKRIDVIEEKVKISSILFFWLNFANLKEFLILASITSFISLSTIVLYLLFKNKIKIKLFWAVFSSFIAVFLNISFCLKFFGVNQLSTAVIYKESAQALSGYHLGDMALFTLHAGAEVTIVDKRNDWIRIELPDGKQGWLQVDSLIF